MLLIFGTRGYLEQLAMLTLACPRCGSTCAHLLRRAYTKFTLFFIPLFEVSSQHQIQCTYCGYASRIDKHRADELLATASSR